MQLSTTQPLAHLHPLQWDGRENHKDKSVNFTIFLKKGFFFLKKKRQRKQNQEKQVMEKKIIAHYQLTYAKPVPEQ